MIIIISSYLMIYRNVDMLLCVIVFRSSPHGACPSLLLTPPLHQRPATPSQSQASTVSCQWMSQALPVELDKWPRGSEHRRPIRREDLR